MSLKYSNVLSSLYESKVFFIISNSDINFLYSMLDKYIHSLGHLPSGSSEPSQQSHIPSFNLEVDITFLKCK